VSNIIVGNLAKIRKGHVPIQVSVLRRGPTFHVSIRLFIIHESELYKFSSKNSHLKDSFVAYAIVTLLNCTLLICNHEGACLSIVV